MGRRRDTSQPDDVRIEFNRHPGQRLIGATLHPLIDYADIHGKALPYIGGKIHQPHRRGGQLVKRAAQPQIREKDA